jgi:PAS domain S-box-containing protein
MAVLAEGFNRMAQRLEQLYEGMEAEVRRRTRDLRVIARLSSEVFKATIPLRETLQAFLGSITQELGYRFASLCLIAPKDGTLRQEYTAGDVSGTSAQVLELSSSHPFAQAVLKAEPLVCEAPEAGLEGLGGRVAVAPVVAHQRRRCREVNACRFRGCPAYGSPDDRCWLLEGTLCRSPKAVRGRPKIYGCVHCKAFPVFGVLVAAKEEVAPQDLDTLRILASIIASVLETHKLIEAAREDIQELVRLHDVAVEYLQYTSLRELLPSVLGAACRFASAPAGALWLREPQGLSLQAVQGLKEELLPARLSVEGPWLRQAFEAGSLLQPPEPHAIHQVSQVMLYHGFNYVALLPLKSKEEPVGLLLLWKKDDFPLSDSQRAIMMLLATQAASAVQMLRLHEGLRESEEKFRSLAEQSPNMIFINRAGRVVYANRRCEEVMGYRREEFYSPDFDFLALVAPESRELVEAYFSRHMRGQECPPYEYTLLTKDGRRIHAINTTRLIQYEGRQAILGIVTDITERKEMEEELRSLLAALRAEKEFSEAIFQSTASGLMVLDAEARVLRINQAGSEILGLRPEELLGRRITELYPALEAMLDIQPTGQEVEITLPRGQRRPVGFSTSPFIDAEGQERGLIVVFRDLTEIKRLQAELRKKQHFEAVGKVVSGVAHEVRNPLFAISSIAQVLEREVEDAKHKGLLQVLLKEAYRIKNLIEELLLYSRPARLNIVPTELEFFLERLRQYIRLKKDIALEVDVPPELKVQADQDKLTQVFLNLLDNALEAGATRVSIRAQRRKDVVEIVLQDNGSGIQGDDLEKVFEPFFTTKKEGTGLGLSICRKLVEEHGGSLRLESGPGGGCAVLMRLPLAP